MITLNKTTQPLSTYALRCSSVLGVGILCFSTLGLPSGDALAQSYVAAQRPALIITSTPVPESLKNVDIITPAPAMPVPLHAQNVSYRPANTARANDVPGVNSELYTKPVQVREIRKEDVVNNTYFDQKETLVTRKVNQIKQDMKNLQVLATDLAQRLGGLEKRNENQSAEYYTAIATINTQLQSGTTPGNPRLMEKLSIAERELEDMSLGINDFNDIALAASQASSEAGFLLEEARAAYSIFGAIEEDHIELAKTEDGINNTVVMIDRVLNTVNDDLRRMAAYVSSERHNLRVLSLGVANGDLYGKSFGSQPFTMAQPFSLDSDNRGPDGLIASDRVSPPIYDYDQAGTIEAENLMASTSSGVPMATQATQPLVGPRALAKIRFDRPDVQYEQPVYTAVNEALRRYPNARFDLVAVHPSGGNAAQAAIESTRSRRNAERVLRALTQMGLPAEKIDLSYDEDSTIDVNEVRIYIR